MGNIDQLFTYLDETAICLEKYLSITYLEGLAEAGENLFQQKVIQPLEDELKHSLKQKLVMIQELDLDAEEIRKSFQLAILKGMKGAVQPHHSMTPDAVSVFMSYLVNKVTEKRKERVSLLDLAVGSGNLMNTLLNQASVPIQAQGFEVDETLLKLAFVSANLQKNEVDLFHQDSLEPLPLQEVDLIVTDVPVGFYPKDEVAKDYRLKRNEGHSYIHQLMIEQAIKMTKPGGFLFFIVPNVLFEGEHAPSFYTFVKEQTNILGLLHLPQSMFQTESHAKSIFMLQKRAEWVNQPKQALLAELPSFSNKEALAQMIQRINAWFETELRI